MTETLDGSDICARQMLVIGKGVEQFDERIEPLGC